MRRLTSIMRGFVSAAALAVALSGCACKGTSRDGGTGEVVWSVACSGLDDFVLSVWANAPDDVFFVGGNGVSARALLLHYTPGAGWVRTTGVSTQILWWVFGFTGQDVWAVGENGEALRYDGGFWSKTSTGTDATLYGVWGAAPDAVWAVGGSIDPLGPKDVFLFWDGDQWIDAQPSVPSGETIFKVWGTAEDDVWAVGTGGVIFHYDGMAWDPVASPTTQSLLTVYGTAANDVWAVGGMATGVLLHWDGAAWTVAAEDFSPLGLNGVWAGAGSSPVIVGFEGYAARVRAGEVEPLPTGVDSGLHAAFGDGTGTWAVGGNLLGGTPPEGTILRFGAPVEACAITEFMQPPVESDGGVVDPCPGGAGSVGPGEECASGRDCQCETGLECWYIVIASNQSTNHFICTRPCANEPQCALDFGAGACCIIPGPQTITSVCHSPGWDPPAGDPCN